MRYGHIQHITAGTIRNSQSAFIDEIQIAFYESSRLTLETSAFSAFVMSYGNIINTTAETIQMS